MRHIMVDLETMGTAPDSAIVAIGAVAFDNVTGQLGQEFYATVDLASSVKAGMKIYPDTVIWWMDQHREAREQFTKQKGASLPAALELFSCYFKNQKAECLWGNGAGFDNVILRTAYELTGITPPWKYKADRCYRTMREVFPNIDAPEADESKKHIAVDDAIYQARHLIAILGDTPC